MDKPFLMAVEDVFSIKGRGTVATGRIERGKVQVNDEVEIIGFDKREDGGDGRRDVPQAARRGPGGRQRGLPAARHREGGHRARPGSGQAGHASTRTRSSLGEVYVLKKEEGGRHTPFFTNYRPQFYIRTTDVTGSVQAARGREDGDAG